MFARIRRATDASADEYGLLGDWAASVDLVVRAATEQAPLDGIAGISEGGTVGAILFSQHLRGEVYLGSGYRGRLVLTFCALTSPAHSRMYADPMPCLASLHLTGDTDTADVWHMGGQTAALFGPWSGVGHFRGGHKLPRLSDTLSRTVDELREQSFGLSVLRRRHRFVPSRSSNGTSIPTCRARPLIEVAAPVRVSVRATATTVRAHWRGKGVLHVEASAQFDALDVVQKHATCHAVVLASSSRVVENMGAIRDFSEPVVSVLAGRAASVGVARAADWLVATRAHIGRWSLAERGPSSVGFDSADAARLLGECTTMLASVGVIGARNTLVSMRAESQESFHPNDVVARLKETVTVSAMRGARFCASGVVFGRSSTVLLTARAGPALTWRRGGIVRVQSSQQLVQGLATWSRAAAIVVELDGSEEISARPSVPMLAVVGFAALWRCDCVVGVGRIHGADRRAISQSAATRAIQAYADALLTTRDSTALAAPVRRLVEHTSKRSISKPALSMILQDHTLRVKADGDSAALSVILMMSDRAGIRASLDNRDTPRPRYQQPGSSLSLTCRYSTLASSHAGRAAWVALLLRPTSDLGMPRLVVHMSCDEPGIVTLELNDPSTLNAMTPELLLGLSFSVRAALLHESARGLVLQAAGPHFCTGGRYDAASQGKVPQWVHGSGLVLDRIRTAPLRSTSVLHGASIGGGLLLGLAADRRVCTPRAVLRLGVAPHGLSPIVRATDAIPRTVGYGVAAQMYLADHELDAQ